MDSNGEELIKLGNLGGTHPTTSAEGINDAGQVVGYSYTTDPGSPTRGFITGPNGVGMTNLGTLGGSYSFALDINNAGQVTGYYGTFDNRTGPFLTGPNGAGISDLDTVVGDSSYAFGINNAGQVVGNSLMPGFTSRAFRTGGGIFFRRGFKATCLCYRPQWCGHD